MAIAPIARSLIFLFPSLHLSGVATVFQQAESGPASSKKGARNCSSVGIDDET